MRSTFGRLIWCDEFDGLADTPPDALRWKHETGGHGWGNDELQWYTSDVSNGFHDGRGNLVIRAIKSHAGITSARLITKGLVEVTYGRLECRAQLAAGAGLWSAFWALGTNIDTATWPGCGEIDIMENLGAEPNRVFGTVHCPDQAGANGVSGGLIVESNLHEDFHVFSIDWREDRIVWRLDDTEYHSVTKSRLNTAWVFDHPFYLLLNLAVGGRLGGRVNPDTRFPADLKIDYVRIYAPGDET